jgi:hypothetical protein
VYTRGVPEQISDFSKCDINRNHGEEKTSTDKKLIILVKETFD